MSITTLGNSTWSVMSRPAGASETQSSGKASSSTGAANTSQEADEYISSSGTVATRESLKLEESEEAVPGVQVSLNTGSAAAAQSSQPTETVATEEEETTVNTVGKPAWISDEHWAAIQENSNTQPSGMSDDDWQAYLQWAGKGTSASSSSQQMETTEQIVASERTTSTSKEIALRTSSENANQYALWNSESANGTRIDISA